MRKITQRILLLLIGVFALSTVFAQAQQPKTQRRPAANAPASDVAPVKNTLGDGSVYILDGVPVLLSVHHDTIVGTNKPVDVYVFVIEMQIMNSDGDLEPEGLQIFNFYTKYPRDAKHDVNAHNARDCKIWAGLQSEALQNHDPKAKTWPYVEMVTAADARVLQTNEDGAVWYSDDVECWGASDRFRPF
jgi:hypothetical protein